MGCVPDGLPSSFEPTIFLDLIVSRGFYEIALMFFDRDGGFFRLCR